MCRIGFSDPKGPKVSGLTYKSRTKWKMLWGIYNAIFELLVHGCEKCVEIKGDYVEKYQSCFISLTLKSWSSRKLLDPTTYVAICCVTAVGSNWQVFSSYSWVPTDCSLTNSGYWLREHPTNRKLELALRGAFLPPYYANMSKNHLSVWIQLVEVTPGFKPVANLTVFSSKNIIFVMVSAGLCTISLKISLCRRMPILLEVIEVNQPFKA